MEGWLYPSEEAFNADSWAVLQAAYQRYLIQLGFIDKQLGNIIEQLKQSRVYDSSLIIITADHGVAYKPCENRRGYNFRERRKAYTDDYCSNHTFSNKPSLRLVPLFIKPPFQEIGKTLNYSVGNIDILPTIVEYLGIKNSNYKFDGYSLYSEHRKLNKTSLTLPNEWKLSNEQIIDDLQYNEKTFGSNGFYDLYTSYYSDLIGKDISSINFNQDKIEKIEIINESTDNSDDFCYGCRISGIVTLKSNMQDLSRLGIAISINGTIRATTKTLLPISYKKIGKSQRYFNAMIDEKYLNHENNNVQAHVVSYIEQFE